MKPITIMAPVAWLRSRKAFSRNDVVRFSARLKRSQCCPCASQGGYPTANASGRRTKSISVRVSPGVPTPSAVCVRANPRSQFDAVCDSIVATEMAATLIDPAEARAGMRVSKAAIAAAVMLDEREGFAHTRPSIAPLEHDAMTI